MTSTTSSARRRLSVVFTGIMAAIALALGMSVNAPAHAAGEYTLTISGSSSGHTFEAYQVFSGDVSENGKTLSNIDWGSGIGDSDALLTALKGDSEIGSFFASAGSASDVAKVLEEWGDNSEELDAFATIVGEYLTKVPSGTSTWDDGSQRYTIANLDAGYYLVKDDDDSLTDVKGEAYTKFMLNLVGSVTVNVKADAPTLALKVYEASATGSGYGDGYADVADASFGDTVLFKLVASIPEMDGYDQYKLVFHAELPDGLTWDSDSVAVYLAANQADSSGSDLTASGYSLSSAGFELTISDLKGISGYNNYGYVVVTFSATLNTDAVIGIGEGDSGGNITTASLEYSNNPNDSDSTSQTVTDQVTVLTYQLNINKVDGEDNNTKLEGARFVVHRLGDGDQEEYYSLENNTVAWVSNQDDATEFTTDENGLVSVPGLDSGEFYLTETKAPDGYNRLAEGLKVTITSEFADQTNWNGTSSPLSGLAVSVDDGGRADGNAATGVIAITVENESGSSLPSTGGVGTTLLYVSGISLIVFASVGLWAMRKRGTHTDNTTPGLTSKSVA